MHFNILSKNLITKGRRKKDENVNTQNKTAINKKYTHKYYGNIKKTIKPNIG